MRGEKGGTFTIIKHPILVVLEAKRSSTIHLPASEAELFGQMKTLMSK